MWANGAKAKAKQRGGTKEAAPLNEEQSEWTESALAQSASSLGAVMGVSWRRGKAAGQRFGRSQREAVQELGWSRTRAGSGMGQDLG